MEPQFKIGPKMIVVLALILVLVAVGFWYWFQKEAEPVGVLETAQDVSESVPEIQTNPGEKVPEINPLDRANPFKYNNPLR